MTLWDSQNPTEFLNSSGRSTDCVLVVPQVSRSCANYAGRVVVQNPEQVGAIQQVVTQVPQV